MAHIAPALVWRVLRQFGLRISAKVDVALLSESWSTMAISVPSSGWNIFSTTSQDNITQNSSATIVRDNMNSYPETGYTITADSSDELLYSLLNEPGQRFGQGEWIWTITADDCHPDIPIDEIDPDQGNDWQLIVDFLLLVPRISEIGI